MPEPMPCPRLGVPRAASILLPLAALGACVAWAGQGPVPSQGPANAVIPSPHRVGDAAAGRDVFRFETFGNEGFWTDAMRLPRGMIDAEFTPVQALKAGLSVDIDALDAGTRKALADELKTDLSPDKAPRLNDPKTTLALINANAVIGVAPKDTDGDGTIDVARGDKVGISCAICHTVTDKSAFDLPGGGSIGRRVDGPATPTLNMGALLALAANSRAYYPNLQVTLGGKTHGRAPKGLTPDSTEAEVDAYLTDPASYPVGTFDASSDGIGNSTLSMPIFRAHLAAPWGTGGEIGVLDNISNFSYTINLDLTTLVTPEGRQFLHKLAGAAGDQLADDYAKVLATTGVKGFPYVKHSAVGRPGEEATPVGRRVDEKKLVDMNAYLNSLPEPRGAQVEAVAAARGREIFRAACTTCHNADQRRPVPAGLVDLRTIWPAYNPVVEAARQPPLNPVQDAPGTFDDYMIVLDASQRGLRRGNALPMLLDLARRGAVLHDASGPSLDSLLDPARGATAPHPFFVPDPAGRSDVVQFLRGLDTGH